MLLAHAKSRYLKCRWHLPPSLYFSPPLFSPLHFLLLFYLHLCCLFKPEKPGMTKSKPRRNQKKRKVREHGDGRSWRLSRRKEETGGAKRSSSTEDAVLITPPCFCKILLWKKYKSAFSHADAFLQICIHTVWQEKKTVQVWKKENG